VILLDTNQLLGKSPDAPVLRMLKKVAEQAGHDLVLPEMVAEEYLAHYRHEVEDAAEKARGGIDELRRLVPRWPGDTGSLRSVEEGAEQSRRAQLADLFRIQPVPGGAWRESVIREAWRRPPAKTSWEQGKPGSGARDVAVWLTVLAVGFSHAPQVARVMRSAALDVSERDFVKAVELLGVKRRKIMAKEILPNLISPLMVESGLRMTYSVVIIAGLSFLGFGQPPPAPNWGTMINENRIGLVLNPWAVIVPAALIALLTIGINTWTDAVARVAIGIDREAEEATMLELPSVLGEP